MYLSVVAAGHCFLGQLSTNEAIAVGTAAEVPVISSTVGKMSLLSTANVWTPTWMVWTPSLMADSLALSRWLRNIGIAIAARMPMMMITIKSSMRVKPPCLWNRFILDLLSLWHVPRLTDRLVLARARPPVGTPNARSPWCSLSRWAPQASRWSSLGWQPSRLGEPCGFAPHLRKWFALYASTPMLPPCAIPRHFFRQNAVGLYLPDWYVRLEDAAPEQLLEPAERLDGLPRHLLLRQPELVGGLGLRELLEEE